MKKTYLVTGGLGFIGSALVRRLIEEGHNVRVLDNLSRGQRSNLQDFKKNIRFIHGDMRDAKTVAAACQNIDSIFHLAFINGTKFFYTMPEVVLEVGVKGMVNILDAGIKNRVKEFFLASSSEVYQTPPTWPTDEKVALVIPDPLNPRYSYAAGKIVSEIMALHYGHKYFDRMVIFRPHNVYGPQMGWEHVIPQLSLRMREICHHTKAATIRFPIQGTGEETRAFVYIEDFIDGLIILKNRGQHLNIYHIGTQEEKTTQVLAKEIGKYFGKRVKVLPGNPAPGGTLRRCPDISKMKALGYRPRYSLREGLSVTVKWYDEHASEAPATALEELKTY